MSKRCVVWEHFDINPVDNSYATCRHFNASVSRGGQTASSWSTSALMKHMMRHHPFVDLTRAGKDGGSSSQPQQSQPDIKEAFDRGRDWEFNDSQSLRLHRAVAEMIALDDQPFSVVDNVGFRRLMQLVEPRYTLPSDTYLRQTAMPDLYKHMCDKVVDVIRDTQSVSFRTNTWTTSMLSESKYVFLYYLKINLFFSLTFFFSLDS